MFGPGTTGAAIDAFESRFTRAAGAHFLIAANGKEAYPIGEAESLAFRDRYRRRMARARWLRRGALLAVIPLMILNAYLIPEGRGGLREALEALQLLILFGLPIAGLVQHPITSALTKMAIERPLKRRMTTRHAPAVTPVVTPLGAFARKLLIAGFAIEAAISLYHALGPRDELAAHMRVLYGLQSGNESMAARLTGSLSWVVLLTIAAGFVLLTVDRRGKRIAAARAKADEAAQGEARSAGAARRP